MKYDYEKFKESVANKSDLSMIGEGLIKAEVIVNAFETYRMQSRLYRILKFLRLR